MMDPDALATERGEHLDLRQKIHQCSPLCLSFVVQIHYFVAAAVAAEHIVAAEDSNYCFHSHLHHHISAVEDDILRNIHHRRVMMTLWQLSPLLRQGLIGLTI
jgi:hypothetical protein